MKRGLADRTKAFALRIIRMYSSLPQSRVAAVLGHQVLRSGTSIGAHYREGYRSRSTAEAISKFEVALQELDETEYWLELLIESNIVTARRLQALLQETEELMAILVASVRTMKRKRR
jgi:four helix bundle protein